jgi:hypothetical protein
VGLGEVFSPRISVSPANLHSICFSTIAFTITRGWHNRPGAAAVPITSPLPSKKSLLVLNNYDSELLSFFGLCPLSRILKTRGHNISDTGRVSILGWRGGKNVIGWPLRKSYPLSLDKLFRLTTAIYWATAEFR